VALTGRLLFSQRLVITFGNIGKIQYIGGLIINIKLHPTRLQLAEIDQSIDRGLVGRSYHKISLIRFQRAPHDQTIKSLKNRRPDLPAEIVCLDSLQLSCLLTFLVRGWAAQSRAYHRESCCSNLLCLASHHPRHPHLHSCFQMAPWVKLLI